MIRALSMGVLALLSVTTHAAEDTEPLDAEFLEYLGTLEGDDDDWTLVAETRNQDDPARKDRKAPQDSKPADPPAVDER